MRGPLLALGALAMAAPAMALQDPPPEPSQESRTAYVRRLFEKNRATYGDACRAILSLVKDDPTDATFDATHQELAERGIVEGEAGEATLLDRGMLATMLVKALGIQGGITMSLFGVSRRYALRECVYRGLIPAGVTGQYVTGRELIDIVTNAGIHRREGSLDSLRK